MSVYANLKQTADKLIDKFGIEYTFFANQSDAYDPICGTRELNTDSTYTAKAVAYPIDVNSATTSQNIDADVTLIAVAGPYQKNDRVDYDGRIYSIMGMQPITPGDTNCCTYLYLQL